MAEGKSTKDSYLIEAMKLFAEKGYDSVGVAEIAQAVGCTTSALYKHYKNKRALFDAIVEKSRTEFRENMARLKVNFEVMSERESLPVMTVEEQVAMMRDLFLAVAFGDEPKLFRRLVEQERCRHPEFAIMYNEHYVKEQIKSFSGLMEAWVEKGAIVQRDSYALAVEYISPLLVMIVCCDNDPSMKQEALSVLERHVRVFNQINRKEVMP